ncbi:WG repeat-containing protein [Gaetbulibacter aquiaggeris]|uniref:WG repeat-containing protein n=1 Tax=Gaetbulibacter aquiaggeris TaxID=1735373 RepID=A0ABW7MQL8_9FLAO
MKKVVILLMVLFLIPVFVGAQTIENLEFISPFNDGLSAIKKDNQWAFINQEGAIVINFRNDLVPTKFNDGNYPVFFNNRCLIMKEINEISYFGYIDTSGKTIIDTQFLNAQNFQNNEAIVLKLTEEFIGKNDVLGKNIVQYKYYEVTIDTDGNINQYLTPKGFNTVLDKKYLKTPPEITSRKISDNLYAIYGENKNWTIIKKINVNQL